MNIECEIVPELGGTALSPITTPSYHSIIWMLNTCGQVFLIHDVQFLFSDDKFQDKNFANLEDANEEWVKNSNYIIEWPPVFAFYRPVT